MSRVKSFHKASFKVEDFEGVVRCGTEKKVKNPSLSSHFGRWSSVCIWSALSGHMVTKFARIVESINKR